MKLPCEFEDQYVKEVLYNTSLTDLPDEEWKLIDDFENYAISNYGRLKSLERWTFLPGKKKGKKEPEMIMKLTFVKQFNQYLQSNFYQVHCTLSSEGENYRKSVARLVYYHFIENLILMTAILSFPAKMVTGFICIGVIWKKFHAVKIGIKLSV